MPYIERTIFQYILRDKCLKEIVNYESDREIANNFAKKHPKGDLSKARELLRCFANKYFLIT